MTWITGYVEFVLKDSTGRLSALQDAVLLQPIVVPGLVFPSFGIWLYAPCFPLVWIWLYVLSGTLIAVPQPGASCPPMATHAESTRY